MLGIVACHFNPAGFDNQIGNLTRWRNAIQHQTAGRPIVLAHARFPQSQSYSIFSGHEFTVCPFDATDRNVLWQKERLLNLAIARLPPSVTKVAWVDADILFLDPDWAYRAEEMLDEHPVIQLFSTVHYLDAQGGINRVRDSWASRLPKTPSSTTLPVSPGQPHANSSTTGCSIARSSVGPIWEWRWAGSGWSECT
ncbi:MAG: hypothetical protein HC841_00420 [Verrucomicrobiae bacterium]|nr:hypothetical protein [Verrucomicrobiae bacterium]